MLLIIANYGYNLAMSNTHMLICPRCFKRALRMGKCLQCGFRGEGTGRLTPQQRLQKGRVKRRRFRSSASTDKEIDIDVDLDLASSDDCDIDSSDDMCDGGE